MARSRGSCGTSLVLLGLLASRVLACSSERADPALRVAGKSGAVALNLLPVSGVTLNAINYVVTGTPAIPGTSLPSGVIPTLGPGKELSFSLPVPVGHGYTVSLSAVAAELPQTITCTGSHGPFDVAPNQTSSFGLTLTCVSAEAGSVGTVAQLESDACPAIVAEFASVIPARLFVGESAELQARARDVNGLPITYAWSFEGTGLVKITSAHAAAATLSCADIIGNGRVLVTLSNGECSKALPVSFWCGDKTCGNGVLDSGESCDYDIPADQPGGSPAGTTYGCPQDCRVACGDGVVESPTEQCELPDGVPTASCSEQCRVRGECGDGFLQPGEQCDGALVPPGTPACDVCGLDCVIRPSRCGDGIVSPQCGEGCEPSEPNCNDACQLVTHQSSECLDCEAGGACASLANTCSTSPGAQTGEAQIQCSAVEQCIVASNCADGTNSLARCFCGALSSQDCAFAPETGPNAPHGACAAQIKAGSGAGATNAQVLSRFTSRSFPAGAAIARLNCLKVDPVCAPVCGF